MRNIGEVIGTLRKQQGVTQDDLGKLTELGRVVIAKIENYQRAVSLEEATRIARALSVEVDGLYGFIQNEEEEENETFVKAFKAKGMDSNCLKEVKRIELLVDSLCTQTVIRRE